jgi:hypothetical protein
LNLGKHDEHARDEQRRSWGAWSADHRVIAH